MYIFGFLIYMEYVYSLLFYIIIILFDYCLIDDYLREDEWKVNNVIGWIIGIFGLWFNGYM